MSVEAPRAVVCGECGGSFDLSARNVRAARERGEAPTCAFCRRTSKPVDPATAARLAKWWTDRFTRDELLELGRGWVLR